MAVICARSVDDYYRNATPWGDELRELRKVLQAVLDSNKRMAGAFAKLRPGQQREYAEFIAEAKREETRARRIARIQPMVIAASGLNDKYKSG